MIMTLIITSLLILGTYIFTVVRELGYIPSSVSATYYTLKHKFWFGFSMISASFFVLPAILEMTDEKYQFLAFLACVGIIMVGVSPNFRSDFERPIHTIGAVMTLLFSQIWVTVINPVFLLIWIPYIISAIIGIEKNWNGDFISSYEMTNPLFWVEIAAILSTYGCLISITI